MENRRYEMPGGGDAFSRFGGHPFGDFGDFGGQRSFMSGFFGGRDPFDDPFFASPFGTMSSSGFFHSGFSPYPDMPRIAAHQPPVHHLQRPAIEELNSDDEESRMEEVNHVKENQRKHRKSNQDPIVAHPDDEIADKKSKHISSSMSANHLHHVPSQPRSQSFFFQSSTVSYGGSNGAYYTSSRTRRSGSDGFLFEEFKEADSSQREATHRVTRGIQNKGHSVTRKLTSAGHVNAMQTLHNLNEDELVGFNEAWMGNAPKHLPQCTHHGSASISQPQRYHTNRYALPSSGSSYRHDINHRVGTGPSCSQFWSSFQHQG